MIDKIREYENRYWLLNDDVYELHFTQFYDEIILKFIQDKEDSENYIYVSDLLNVEHDEEFAESVEDAMEQFEYMVIDYIKEKIGYYEEMLDKFQEEKWYMTVESLINILDKEITFEIFQAHDNVILFDSSRSRSDNYEWENVKNRIVSEFYPTDTRELYIYVLPNWRK